MPKYEVTVIETLSKTFTVDAESPQQALEQTKTKFENCEINLTTDDYLGVSYEVEGEGISIS